MRDKVALSNIGVPTPACRVLGDPSPCGGSKFNVGPSHLSLLTKLQVVDDLDLESGDPAQRGRPGALLGTVSEVGEAGSGRWSSKMPLNRVGSLEQMVESEHCRISLPKETPTIATRSATVMRCGNAAWPWLHKEMGLVQRITGNSP